MQAHSTCVLGCMVLLMKKRNLIIIIRSRPTGISVVDLEKVKIIANFLTLLGYLRYIVVIKKN